MTTPLKQSFLLPETFKNTNWSPRNFFGTVRQKIFDPLFLTTPLWFTEIFVPNRLNGSSLSCSQFVILCTSLYIYHSYMSFRPTPFQPLQFQPLRFQPFTLSTVHTFNRLPFRPLANSTATNSTYLSSRLFNFCKTFENK